MSENLAQQWLAGIVDVSLQFTVLVAIVAAFVLVLRSLTPRVRYFVWLVVLFRLAIPVGVTSPLGAVPPSLLQPRLASSPGRDRLPASEFPETTAPSQRIGVRTAPSSGSVSPGLTLFTLWAGVVLCLFVAQVARAVKRRARVRSAMEPPSAELAQRIDALRTEVGVRQAVETWVVRDDAIEGPAIRGFLRPQILLPSSLTRSWRRKELEPVLLHELIHIERKDTMARALANVLQIVYFFHPLVWWVNRRLREEREKACDDAVVHQLRGEKSMYIGSLLRLVEERSASLLTPELRMVTARRPLARRLRRMLQTRYNPNPKVGAFALSSLVLGVSLGLTLSTEARVPAQAQVEASPQIRARIMWVGAFFEDSIDQLDDAQRVELGGDFTVGRPATPVKPDAEALAKKDPGLFRRLEALGQLSTKLIIDREGHVRRIRFEGEVDEDIQQALTDVLNVARFEPTTHYDRGPVIVELRVDYFINPEPPQQSFYESGKPLVGNEVAEIIRLVPDSDDAQDAIPIREGLARYAAILARGEPPVLEVTGGEFILAYGIFINAQGNVESASLFRDSRTGPNDAPQSTPETDALVPFLETFRFEPLVLSDGAPARGILMLDVRVSGRGIEVATRTAVKEEELERRLSEVYRLSDGRNLDLRPPPHPPERLVLYRTGNPVQARVIPSGPSQMTILWKDDRPTLESPCFGCDDLLSVLMELGVDRYAVRFEGGAENVHIEADIVKREGASQEELLVELSEVLREKFDLELSFEEISETTQTLVLRGAVGAVSPDDERDGRRVLHVFTDGKNEDSRTGAGGGPFSDGAMLVTLLSSQLQMPVVDRTTGAVTHSFHVQFHRSAYATKRLDLLIQNLESQTDLDIAIEERLEPIVVVSTNPR